MQTVSIIIPVYNEEKRIVQTIKEVMKADTLGMKKEIIVVDDGSTDNTWRKITNFQFSISNKKRNNQITNKLSNKVTNNQIKLIQLPYNQGKGVALKVGFKKATGDILLVQDGDLEYSTDDYPMLLKPFIEKKALVVYGSRNKARKKYKTPYSSFFFYWGGIFLTWIINLLFGTKLSDQATGYKLFSKNIKFLLLKPKENRFSYEVAVTAILSKNNIPISEVPIHYKPRSVKEGKKINMKDFIKSVLVAIKYKFVK